MPAMLTINLTQPFKTVEILPDGSDFIPSASSVDAGAAVAANRELTAQTDLYKGLCQTLQSAIDQLNAFYEELFTGHNEAIARLSVEIARKVLMRNITDGDYEIEAIVKETLKNAPAVEDIVIRLNPQDLTDYRTIQPSGDNLPTGVELLADPDIGRAECILESPKGIVQSLIDEHLERIGKALERTQ